MQERTKNMLLLKDKPPADVVAFAIVKATLLPPVLEKDGKPSLRLTMKGGRRVVIAPMEDLESVYKKHVRKTDVKPQAQELREFFKSMTKDQP